MIRKKSCDFYEQPNAGISPAFGIFLEEKQIFCYLGMAQKTEIDYNC